MATRDECLTRDANDALAPLRGQFALERVDAEGIIYLDGNSLGVLPKVAIDRVRDVVEQEWGVGLIRSWNDAGWITLSQRVGDKIAPLIDAAPGEVIVADSTSINLYKMLSAAITLARPRRGASRIMSERGNFPTDLYIADSIAREHGLELILIDGDDLHQHLDDRVAILMLTHVDYRTGRMLDMPNVTRAAHDAGALMIWDLAHSAGAMPINLTAANADFAVGCGYKYLNGGPGAPAFAWAHPRHIARLDRDRWRPPLSGWMGHATPFAFTPEYQPAPGMSRFLCGTPPVISLAALECGIDTILAATQYGGLDAVRQKSIALTDLFIHLVESRCAQQGLTLASPRDPAARGSQVSFAYANDTDGYAIMQALMARGVIGDFRAPNILRFGFTPLYTRFVDVWDAVDRLVQILATGEWRDPRFTIRAAVT
jgi:kynureninase